MFHHGRELISRDVKFTIESILDPATKSPKKGGFNLVERIEAPDKYTLKVFLKEVNAAFIHNMQIGILPEDIARKLKDDFQSKPVGAGPFKFKDWERGTKLILVKNENYFENGPFLKEIQFKLIKENTVRLLELEKGTVDFLQNDIPPDFFDRLISNDTINVIKSPSTNFSYIGFNFKDPLLCEKEIRKAIAYAIDRDKIIKYILKNDAQKATGLISPLNWAYESDVIIYDFNPEKAKEILNRY